MSQSNRGLSPQELEQELRELEKQIKSASPGYETQFLNQAGNLCVEAGQPKRALAYYGRAIDAYLESGRFNAAEVVCQKLLRISPDAVRARCTLAWLSIGKGYKRGVERDIADYVSAAKKAGQEKLAAAQLRMMAEASVVTELQEALANHLLDLGEFTAADRVLGAVYAERNGLQGPAARDEGKLWARLLRAALMTPDELHAEAREGHVESDDALPALRGS